jgi:hypothetical protein
MQILGRELRIVEKYYKGLDYVGGSFLGVTMLPTKDYKNKMLGENIYRAKTVMYSGVAYHTKDNGVTIMIDVKSGQRIGSTSLLRGKNKCKIAQMQLYLYYYIQSSPLKLGIFQYNKYFSGVSTNSPGRLLADIYKYTKLTKDIPEDIKYKIYVMIKNDIKTNILKEYQRVLSGYLERSVEEFIYDDILDPHESRVWNRGVNKLKLGDRDD